jgi:hypothetical protein
MYEVMMHGMTLGGVSICDYSTALFDTGNTLISFPMSVKDALFEGFSQAGLKCETQLEANKDYSQIACSVDKLEDIPDLSVDLNGVIFTIKGKDLIDKCQIKGFLFQTYACVLNLELQQGGNFYILGKAFLSQTYTTFFLDKGEIWLSQPSKEKYKALIDKAQPKHDGTNSHMTQVDNGVNS